jgi:TolB protein
VVAATALSFGALALGCQDHLNDLPVPQAVPADMNVAWSPDGQWLAFDYTDRATPYLSIYVARVDGSERRLVAPQGSDPAWSPDGSALLFNDGGIICRVDLVSGSIAQLASVGRSVEAAWSPNGGFIAFSSDREDPDRIMHIWLMNADGGAPRRVPGSRPLIDPDWSPTGERLVAYGAVRVNGVRTVMTVFVTDTLGRDTIQVTPVAGGDAEWPKWHPAGEWIAYTRMTPPGEVRMVRPDGTGDHLLVANGFQPAWSPDGQRLAFSRRNQNEVAVWSVDQNGRDLRRLTWPTGQPGNVM